MGQTLHHALLILCGFLLVHFPIQSRCLFMMTLSFIKSEIIPQFVTIYYLAIGKDVKQVPEQTSCGTTWIHDPLIPFSQTDSYLSDVHPPRL